MSTESSASEDGAKGASTLLVRVAAVVLLLVPILYAAFQLLAPDSSALGPVRGLRLGLTPSQAREQFEAGAGAYRTELSEEDVALHFTPEDAGELRSAVLEFHLGQLVALRLRVDEDAAEAEGPALEQSDVSVLSREQQCQADGCFVELTWLARTCPTHAEEVDALLQQ